MTFWWWWVVFAVFGVACYLLGRGVGFCDACRQMKEMDQ
jgi:hypothetical protein